MKLRSNKKTGDETSDSSSSDSDSSSDDEAADPTFDPESDEFLKELKAACAAEEAAGDPAPVVADTKDEPPAEPVDEPEEDEAVDDGEDAEAADEDDGVEEECDCCDDDDDDDEEADADDDAESGEESDDDDEEGAEESDDDDADAAEESDDDDVDASEYKRIKSRGGGRRNSPVVLVIGGNGGGNGNGRNKRKRSGKNSCDFSDSFTEKEEEYWKTLNENDQKNMLTLYTEVKKSNVLGDVPIRFRMLTSEIDMPTKNILLSKIEQFNNMNDSSSEYFKLRNWLTAIARLPLGKIHPLPVQPSDPPEKCAAFLQETREKLDKTVYGHFEAKDQIMRILAQWISNPSSRGNCIGIHGPPGIAKTVLVKDGICKALELPFGFIALGGASDASFLEGHNFTYEGSTYGKISEVLMKTQCMNPVIFFDELDKVSSTHRGDEIIGTLTHLTDSSQNEKYNDRYFAEIDLNLSKSLIIFSYNDESRINPILKDRMISIHVKGYNPQEKQKIALEYLLPQIFREYKLTETDIVFRPEIIDMVINRVKEEEGVRNLKRGLDAIVSWINMFKYMQQDEIAIEFPFIVKEEHVKKFLKQKESNPSLSMMYL